MRCAVAAVFVACLLIPGTLGAQDADMLKVIPEKTLLVLASRDPAKLERHLGAMQQALSGEKPREGFLRDELLYDYDLHHRFPFDDDDDAEEVEDELAGLLDREGPMALVWTGGVTMSGVPVGVVVRVKDYRGLLKKLAERNDLVGPEVTAWGTDMIRGEFESLYARRLGDWAVFSRTESTVRFFADEKGASLADADPGGFVKAYRERDLALYVNADEVLKANAFIIGIVRMSQQQQARAENEALGGPLPPEEAARRKARELDMMLEWLGQIDALVAGTDFDEKGIRAGLLGLPRKETKLERIAQLLEPARLGLMETFQRQDFVVAAGWYIPPDLAAMMDSIELDYDREAGRLDEKQLAHRGETMRELREGSTGEGALVWDTSGEDEALIRMLILQGVKRDVGLALSRAKEMREDMELDEEFPVDRVQTKVEENVERHRDCAIHRVTITFKEVEGANPLVAKMFRAFFGAPMVVHGVDVPGATITSLGHPDAVALKAQLDRMLDETPGDLVRMSACKEALEGLPERRAGVMVLSMSSAIRMISQFVRRVDPQTGQFMGRVNLHEFTAMGLTLSPSPAGLQIHLHVPIAELKSIKKAIEDLMRPTGARVKELRLDFERKQKELDAEIEETDREMQETLKKAREIPRYSPHPGAPGDTEVERTDDLDAARGEAEKARREAEKERRKALEALRETARAMEKYADADDAGELETLGRLAKIFAVTAENGDEETRRELDRLMEMFEEGRQDDAEFRKSLDALEKKLKIADKAPVPGE